MSGRRDAIVRRRDTKVRRHRITNHRAERDVLAFQLPDDERCFAHRFCFGRSDDDVGRRTISEHGIDRLGTIAEALIESFEGRKEADDVGDDVGSDESVQGDEPPQRFAAPGA